MDREGLVVSDALTIASDELEWRFSASGGPGGQHVNTSNTRVELSWDIAGSHSLTDEQRARLVERLGDHVRVVASSERSQYRNRTLAQQRLADRIGRALVVAPRRRATRPTRGSVERRIQEKREQSSRKSARRARPEDE